MSLCSVPTRGQLIRAEGYTWKTFPLPTHRTVCVHKAGMHAGKKNKTKKNKGAVVFYLSHTLSSLLFLIQGGGVQGFIGNEIGALNVINGFDFWNGS